MNGIDPIFIEHSANISALKNIDTASISDEKKKQAAKDFESVLINKLLDEMKNTIGCWDDEEDGAKKQIQGIFNMYLSREIAQTGGFGLWKDIYKTMYDKNMSEPANKTMDSIL